MRKIKNIVIMIMAILGVSSCTAKTEKSTANESAQSKMLVCYFSATGTTAKAAERLAKIAGADIYEITPQELYTDADLDWRNKDSRSSVEMHNREFRPAIVDSVPDLSQYDTIFIGYPNWWNTHPTVINTFIESNDLKGKTIVPFMTSGGSTIANSEKELREQYPDLTFVKGLLMNRVTDQDIQSWLNTL